MKNPVRVAASLMILPLLLEGCGDLPRPFQNNPGATAERLSQPPPSQMLIRPPLHTGLPAPQARAWADVTATALTNAEVPSIVADDPTWRGWSVELSAMLDQGIVTPVYTVHDSTGKVAGSFKAAPLPASQWRAENTDGFLAETTPIAQPLADLLTGIETAREERDPNSLLHRPPRVALTGITGAPGDGDEELTLQMNRQLPQLGAVLQPAVQGADYTLRCTVHIAPVDVKTQRVEVIWIVTDARGQEAGRVAQLHDIAAGSLDHYWGEVAVAVVQQAAAGVKQVMTNQLITHQKRSS